MEAPALASEAKATMLVPIEVSKSGLGEPGEVRIDIRRGQMTVQMAWPIGHAAALGQWMKELLR
jgi:hypothetical protein